MNGDRWCRRHTQDNAITCRKYLNEYYEIVGESRPLSGFFPTHADFCIHKCISNHETSNPPSFRVIRALIASQSTFEI